MERACRWGDDQPTAATRAQESRAPVFRAAIFPPLRVSGRSGGAPGRRSSPFRVIASDCPRVSLTRERCVLSVEERLIAAMMLCLSYSVFYNSFHASSLVCFRFASLVLFALVIE